MNADHEASPEASSGSMVLVFRVEGEAFALPVDIVNEILDPQDPTPVPNADPFAPGVINVRGVVVPVVDIRLRLDMTPPSDVETARMIVIEHEIDGAASKLAFVADAVEQVVEASLDTLEKVPDLGALWPQVYLRGAFRRGEDLIVVLDPATLFLPPSTAQQEAA